MTVVSHSPWETRAMAERIAALLEPGDVVLLEGDLGAGKTAFVQGVAAAMGIEEPVLSPTFVMVREYEAEPVLVHVDVYRLETPAQVLDLGLEELLDGQRVVLVEWGDRIRALVPDRLEIVIELGGSPEERRITVHAEGPRWHRRRTALERALSADGGTV